MPKPPAGCRFTLMTWRVDSTASRSRHFRRIVGMTPGQFARSL
jgi:AraC-like DNA-binding protein